MRGKVSERDRKRCNLAMIVIADWQKVTRLINPCWKVQFKQFWPSTQAVLGWGVSRAGRLLCLGQYFGATIKQLHEIYFLFKKCGFFSFIYLLLFVKKKKKKGRKKAYLCLFLINISTPSFPFLKVFTYNNNIHQQWRLLMRQLW
jgi:hypothetical protein